MTTLALDAYLTDWLDLLLRWLHVIAAMAWIGTSFYFVLLDQSLRDPRRREDADAGVAGELWEVHGGGFYQVQKYRVAPPVLPDHLAWFKWEAYTTWLSGLRADDRPLLPERVEPARRPDRRRPRRLGGDRDQRRAARRRVGGLRRPQPAAPGPPRRCSGSLIGALTVVAAWGSSELFAPRAAWLQVGAMLGTIMSANVFFVIIPAHRELIRAKEAGRDPDPAPAIQAKQRSVHNNYLTLPVLLTMLAGHMAFAYSRDRAWLVLVALLLIGVWARLFFNLRHQGRTHWWMPVVGVAAVVAVAWWIRPPDAPLDTRGVAGERRRRLRRCGLRARATRCPTPARPANVGPNLDAASPSYDLVVDRVTNGQGGMPAFAGELTDEQIADVAAYVSTVAGQ